MKKRVSDKKSNGRKLSQVQRLQALSGRVEYLWDLVIQRLTISEREISRKIDVWGADWLTQPEHAVPKEKVYQDLTAPGTPYWRLKKVMDTWCSLWFWPLDKVELLDGTDARYVRVCETNPVLDSLVSGPAPAEQPTILESTGFEQIYVTESLFSLGDEQLDLVEFAQQQVSASRKRQPVQRPKLEPVRAIIPLQTLDDWLDFAEAVLGRADVSEDSLATSFASLADLEGYEDQLPVWMGMDSEFKLGERFPWLGHAEDLAERHAFFHWELQFAHVFNRGGFDLQVGNPPWVRPRWEESPILAELDPWFMLTEKPAATEVRSRRNLVLSRREAYAYFASELSSVTGMVEILGGGVEYSLLAGTQPDLYRAFMCRTWNNLSQNGVVGLLHPDSHFGGAKEGRLRSEVYRHLRLHAHFHNRRGIFSEIHANTEFGVQIYGRRQEIGFTSASWLFDSLTLLRSIEHDGQGELPGIKHAGKWDVRPHRARLLYVDVDLLAKWQALTGSDNVPLDQTPLLYPVTTAEARAIEALATYPHRVGALQPNISRGYDEANGKKNGLIEWNTSRVESLDDLILQGPHLAQATPFGKQPNIPCKTNRDWTPWDLSVLPEDAVPVTNYRRASNEETFSSAQDLWVSLDGSARRYVEFYRLAWRRMIPFDTERSLFAALIMPGPAHLITINSLAMPQLRDTVLTSGMWSALPIDYRLRVTGKADLTGNEVLKMPSPVPGHPLAAALLLRTLRLNCLTNSYAPLWNELYESSWEDESWAFDWPRLQALGNISDQWHFGTPLRTEYERRAALVELDAIVALWLGITAEQLVAIYRSRYPILSDYEAQTWFDSGGRKIAANHHTFGYGQTKEHFQDLLNHLNQETNGPVPNGYEGPFYRADREAEYRQAHAVFAERVRRAGWPIPADPRSQEGAE